MSIHGNESKRLKDAWHEYRTLGDIKHSCCARVMSQYSTQVHRRVGSSGLGFKRRLFGSRTANVDLTIIAEEGYFDQDSNLPLHSQHSVGLTAATDDDNAIPGQSGSAQAPPNTSAERSSGGRAGDRDFVLSAMGDSKKGTLMMVQVSF
jgi:hypothetical protein